MNRESQERGQYFRARGTACAACNWSERRCPPDCFWAPYFPHGHQQEFRIVHEVFGARKVAELLKTLEPKDRSTAVKSMITEAEIRLKDPAGGCHRIIQDLKKQIQDCKDELAAVNNQIEQAKNNAGLGGITDTSVGDIPTESRDSTKKG